MDHAYAQNLAIFYAHLKIGAIYALYSESFCDKNLAIRKVYAFCDSARRSRVGLQGHRGSRGRPTQSPWGQGVGHQGLRGGVGVMASLNDEDRLL